MTQAFRPHNTFSLEQAVGAEPSLAALSARIQASQKRLQWIKPVIPAALQRHVKAGPLEDGAWCLLVSNSAASAKLRHLLPIFQQVLHENGAKVTSIRIKVQVPS